MASSKHINLICSIIAALTLCITLLFICGGSLGLTAAPKSLGYESRLFDDSKVHTLHIVLQNWDEFIAECENEEYVSASVIIDEKSYQNVGLRAKGNTSLSQVKNSDSDRYSFKLEFDHYDTTQSYYGLDKLSLNNIIQDNTYLKDYLSYKLMAKAGAAAPLCSFVEIYVNGEQWGLYLAVEGIEESFLARNGQSGASLYKPDSMDMGGGAGNGGKFNMEDWQQKQEQNENGSSKENTPAEMPQNGSRPTRPEGGLGGNMPQGGSGFGGMPPGGGFGGNMPQGGGGFGGTPPDGFEMPEGEMPEMPGDRSEDGFGSRGSSDTKLLYTDDDPDSYKNIFENAKTDITSADKSRLIASLKALNEGTDIEGVVDTEAVIAYFVAHNFVVNFDSYTGSMIHNYYLTEQNGTLSMLPWDYNLAFGGFGGGKQDATSLVNYPIDTPVSGGDMSDRPMLLWIFENEQYTARYHELFADFLSYFESGEFTADFEHVQALISPYVKSDPTKFCSYEQFETGCATLKEFCTLRAESIAGQLTGTIPATSEGQSQQSDTLIDASHLTISDMGSMGDMGRNNR